MGEVQNIRYIQRALYRIPVFIQIIPVKLFVSYVISRDLLAFVISRFVINRFYYRLGIGAKVLRGRDG